MRKLTILFALLTLSAGLWAQEVGETFYDADAKLNFEITAVGETNTVAVIANSSYFLITTCTVPVSVTYKSVTFTVTSLGSRAFVSWSALQTITLPSSVTTIGDYAFELCEALQSIDLSHITTIGNNAFRTCKSLQSVDLSHVTTIGEVAFNQCSALQSISLPASVTTIGNKAFYGCSSLTDVTVAWTDADKITVINKDVFSYIADRQGPSGATLRVPEGTKALYQAKDVWNTFGKIIDLAEIKATAIAEIETAAASAKADIDNASTYEEAKETQDYNKALIDATIRAATNAINNATTEAGVEKKRDEALAEIATINAKVEAIAAITTARQGIQNTNINNWIDGAITDIQKSTTKEDVDRIKNEILEVISIFQDGKAEGDAAGYQRAKNELPTDPEAAAGAAVVVTKGDKEVILYAPDKVKFIKVSKKE